MFVLIKVRLVVAWKMGMMVGLIRIVVEGGGNEIWG